MTPDHVSENEMRARGLLDGPLFDYLMPKTHGGKEIAIIANALDEAEARGRNQALVIVESELIPDRDHSSEDYAAGWHAARSHIMARLHRWPLPEPPTPTTEKR